MVSNCILLITTFDDSVIESSTLIGENGFPLSREAFLLFFVILELGIGSK